MITVELEKLMLWREIQKAARELIAMGAGDVRFERKITEKELTDDEDQNEVSDI